MHASKFLLLGAAIALAGCRPDPGAPSYPDEEAVLDDTGGITLPQGPDPYEEGEDRLSLGLFYESGYSELVEINDLDTHYYIYSDTYTQGVDTQDVVEGRESTIIEHSNVGWFGGGITWDSGRDLSDWTTLYVSMRSSDAGFADIALHLVGGVEATVDLVDYGWTPDGQWHHLSVPLADLEAGGANLTAVTGPFVLIGAGGADGDTLKIDNLYLTQD